MCRLAAFPPGCSPEQAHEIVADFLGSNNDGVGSGYVKNGEFIQKRYPYSYKEALVKKDDLFDHMPYDGWTLAHVRWGTHGENTVPNTHPIIRGDLLGVHNGVFSSADLIRVAMDGAVQWSGETDTEVALYLHNKLGRDKFYKTMPSGAGVYLTLNRKGELDAVKLSGDMKFLRLDNGKYIIASSFPFKYKDNWTQTGCYGFKADGTPRDWTPEAEKKKTGRYTRSDVGYGCQSEIWRQGRQYHGYDGEGCATGAQSGVTPPTHISADDDDTKRIVIIRNGKEETAKTISPPSLWDWKTEQEILDYVRAML